MLTLNLTHPVAVSAHSANHVFGLPWRAVLKLAKEHSVPVLGSGHSRIVEIAPLLAAMRAAVPLRPLDEMSDEEQLEHYRRKLGMRRRTSS